MILIQVSVVDEVTGAVKEQFAVANEGVYGYQVEQVFESLAKKVAAIVDQSY